MKQKIKNIFRKPTKKALGKLGLFLIFGIMIGNLNISWNLNNKVLFKNKAVAAQCTCWDHTGAADYTQTSSPTAASSEECANICASTGDGYYKYGAIGNFLPILSNKKTASEQFLNDAKNVIFAGLKLVLTGVLYALSELVKFAGALIDLVITPEFFLSLINNRGIYTGWVIVRDVLNMFFMLLLLFSAFATIFQVEKYHLRKVIIMLVVMALLVNFSFAISKFVIDFSNSAMYFLFDAAAFSSGSASGIINEIVGMGGALSKTSSGPNDVGNLILTIILLFVVFCTLISIGLNLLIRIVAFAVLIILSPAGFVFAFFPDTKSVSSSWWSALFKYAFLGPIMAFFLYLSILIFKINKTINYTGLNGYLSDAFTTFIVPIVFLWIGLIASQRFGGDGAGVAMSIARGTGNRIRRYSQTLAWGGTRMAGRGIDNAFGAPVAGTWNAVKNRWNQFGEDYKTASNRRAAEVGDRIGVRGANEKLVRENLKRLKEEGSSEAELTRLANGTVAERMASALFRAENNRFDNDPAIAQAQYNNAMNAARGHQVYENQFLGNARKTNMDLVINERITQSGANTPAAMQTIIRDELGRLDPDQWRDQNIQRMTSNATPNRPLIITEGANVINGYSQQGRDNVTRNMRGAKLNAGRHINNGGAGLWA